MSDSFFSQRSGRYFPVVFFRVMTPVAVGLLALVGSVASAALPLPPQVFLDALPEVPEGWELTVSRGRALITNEHGYSQVERSYAAGEAYRTKAALLAAESETPLGPLAVNVQAFDTIKNAIAKIEFAAWKETGLASGPTAYLRLGGHKAIAKISENGPLRVSLLINDRFVVRMEFVPTATVEQATPWISGIDAKALARYRHAAELKVEGKEELSLTTDELNLFKYVVEVNGRMEEVETPTRSYLTRVVKQSKREAGAVAKAIARGEIPGEPTAQEYEKMKEVRKQIEASGGYDPEADLEEMEKRGLLPKTPAQPAPTLGKENDNKSAEGSSEEPEKE